MNEALPLLFCADGYRFPDVYHTTRFLSPDPIIALEEVEELIIVTSSLEEGRAKKESRATSVINWDRYGAQELAAQGVQGPELTATVIKRFLDERELARVALPAYFSVGIADRLREMGVELVVLNDLGERRRAKRPDELEADMARHVDTYSDEWADVLADPARLRRFTSFINAPDASDPNIIHVPERSMPRAARAGERPQQELPVLAATIPVGAP